MNGLRTVVQHVTANAFLFVCERTEGLGSFETFCFDQFKVLWELLGCDLVEHLGILLWRRRRPAIILFEILREDRGGRRRYERIYPRWVLVAICTATRELFCYGLQPTETLGIGFAMCYYGVMKKKLKNIAVPVEMRLIFDIGKQRLRPDHTGPLA